jgi:hypothetical protein
MCESKAHLEKLLPHAPVKLIKENTFQVDSIADGQVS